MFANNEEELQLLLSCLALWCDRNGLKINKDKSKIIQFRIPASQHSNFAFSCGDIHLDYTHTPVQVPWADFKRAFDFNITAKAVAQSASRALGLLIAISNAYGGLPFGTFTRLYDSTVYSVISYGASIWGTREDSCTNAVQHRACRIFLGVGKFTPNVAVDCDMGWLPSEVCQWTCVIRLWRRFKVMDISRINYKEYRWAESKK